MRADRLLSLVMLLQARGKMTSEALARELEVSRRTILRDIDALSSAGIPIYAEGGHGGGIALDEKYRLSLTGLKEAEVRSLFIASSTRLLSDLGLSDAAESSLLKLFTALPTLHQQAVEHVRQRVYIDPVWWWHDSQPLPFWEQLQQAVYEDRRILARYENAEGQIAERILEPYSLVAKASLWYLVAVRAGELRTYRVSRFHDVQLLEDRFERRADFDLEAYWQWQVQQFLAGVEDYAFTLRLHNSRIDYPRTYTPGRYQILTPPDADGWVTARFQFETREFAIMFVLGLGKYAEIVEPEDLRTAVVSRAREALAHVENP